jgi:hypothetical protein
MDVNFWQSCTDIFTNHSHAVQKNGLACPFSINIDFKIGLSLPSGGQAPIDRGAASLHN